MSFPSKRSLAATRRRGRWEETANKRIVEEKDRERKEDEDNFVPALAGATLNCGLPTLINFGRFISSCSTRRGKDSRVERAKETERLRGRGWEAITN